MKKAHAIYISVLFLAVIFLIPILTEAFEDVEWNPYEHRAMAQTPPYSSAALLDGSYFPALEEYLSDQIAFRTPMLTAKAFLEANLLRRPAVNEMILQDNILLSQHPNTYGTVDQSMMEETAAQYTAVADYVKSYGGTFLFIGIPHQASFFRERYPDEFQVSFSRNDSLNQYFYDLLAKNDVDFIDMTPRLTEDSYYFKNDHHYTLSGAYQTYLAFTERLADEGIDVPVFTEGDDFQWGTVSNNFLGSRNRAVYNVRSVPEKLLYYTETVPLPFCRWDDGNEVEATVFDFPQSEDEFVAYSLYMGGDNPNTVIKTDRTSLPNLMIFGESYTNAFETFVYHSFHETHSVDFRYYEDSGVLDYIKEYQPDVVVCLKDDTSFHELVQLNK